MATVWGYNSDSGVIDSADSSLFWFAFHSGIGWHGPFNSKQEAIDYYNRNKDKNPGWKAPTDSTVTAIGNTLGVGGLGSTLDKLGNLDIGNLLLRVGEIVLGIVLIAVGVAKLTGTTSVITKALKVV